jgi:hypothetical protein
MNDSLRTRRSSELVKTLGFKIVLVILVLGELVGATFGGKDWAAHRRIRAVLASANPCDFDQATADLGDYGTDEERSQMQSRKAACAEQTYNAHCDAVATHLDSRRVTTDDLAFIASDPSSATWAKDLVQRVGLSTFSAADLSTSKAGLPCDDKIWSRVVRAAATTPTAWSLGSGGTSPNLSDDMKMALAQARADSPSSAPKTALSVDVQRAIQVDEDTVAPPALTKTSTDDMSTAQTLCELGTVLRVAPTASCVTLGERYGQAKAREDAVAAAALASQKAKARAEQARDDANAARCQAIEEARARCLEPCMDIDLFDPRADRCQEACERRFPKSGCE